MRIRDIREAMSSVSVAGHHLVSALARKLEAVLEPEVRLNNTRSDVAAGLETDRVRNRVDRYFWTRKVVPIKRQALKPGVLFRDGIAERREDRELLAEGRNKPHGDTAVERLDQLTGNQPR